MESVTLKADLPLSSESRQNQSLAGARCSTLPLLGAQGGLLGLLVGGWGGEVRLLSVTPCSCYSDSSSNLAAWPNEGTLSPWDKGGRMEVYRGGQGPILAGAGSLPRTERYWADQEDQGDDLSHSFHI